MVNSGQIDKGIVTISKETLATLPAANFSGEIVVVDKPEQVASAVADLMKADIIGFDTETRPSFKKGQIFNVSLIQLCTPKRCYLFRTNLIGYPDELMQLLANPKLIKVGLSIRDDFHHLRKHTDLEPASFIDLQSFVKDYKIADNSLSRLYAILFGERISKSQRLTNWEAPTLTDAQKNYAALDAYACISIYKYLKEGKFNPFASEYFIIPYVEEVKEKEITDKKEEN